ncbi:MAG: class I SAM-dependent methyltransferase [Clostridia bacterium]|nr:class I SAM-dependent methyltransferase [Clostridia bacterium]
MFELLNDDCGYETWSQYLLHKIAALLPPADSKQATYNASKATCCGLDIGCGNGFFTRAFSKAGYSMTGMDISPEMLSKAADTALSSGIRAQFIQGDITAFHIPQKQDFALAINDCLNYVPPEKLHAAFSHVHGALRKGAPFIFDITAPDALLAQDKQVYMDDRPSVTCIWYSEAQGNALRTDVTVFTKAPDGTYTRRDERQTRYMHADAEIRAVLEACGFSAVKEDLPPEVAGKRLNYICTRL